MNTVEMPGVDTREDNPQEEQEEQGQQAEQEEIPPPQKPSIVIMVAADALSAQIELRRVAPETLGLEREDVIAALTEKGVVSGIDENCVDRLCKSPFYDVAVEIARGKPSKMGTDGELRYLIETKREMRPTIGADGTADYRDLGLVRNVEKGQPLCEVIHPTKGEDGFTVYGAVLDGTYGRKPSIPNGKNTIYDEEQSLVLADSIGNVIVATNGVISVQEILKINGNVDNSTGNINFVADVVISGDVVSGFMVTTKGDITVKGTVEGAILNAEGNITVGGSINGMGSARITAGKSVRSKNIQNCTVVAGEDIYADSVMYCTVECGGNMELSGKHGTLIGGKTTVAKTLTAKMIGTPSHALTTITMAGGGLKHNERIVQIKREIAALESEMISLVQAITWCQELLMSKRPLKPMQMNAFENARARLPLARVDLDNKNAELDEAQQALAKINPEDTYIKCSGRIHSGVKIVFGLQSMNVQASFVNGRVYLNEGQITISYM